jgi:putative transcriptional regulator
LARFTLNPDAPPQLTTEERKRLNAMTDAEITAAAESDPDNPPLTQREMTAFRVARLIKKVRSSRSLSQREFSTRYHIPVGNVRDWEQGRSVPDQTSLAYLAVIESSPDVVEEALRRKKPLGSRP